MVDRRQFIQAVIAGAVCGPAAQPLFRLVPREPLVVDKILKLEAGPIIFDDALITTALLHSELVPSVHIDHLRHRGG